MPKTNADKGFELLKQGEHFRAEQEFKKKEYWKNDSRCFIGVLQAYEKQEKFAEGIALYNDNHPFKNSPKTLLTAGKCYAGLNDHKTAINFYLQVRKWRNDINILQSLEFSYRHQCEYLKAIECIDLLLVLVEKENNVDKTAKINTLLYNKARCQKESRQHDEAIKTYLLMTNKNDAYLGIAHVYETKNDLFKAAEYVFKMSDLAENDFAKIILRRLNEKEPSIIIPEHLQQLSRDLQDRNLKMLYNNVFQLIDEKNFAEAENKLQNIPLKSRDKNFIFAKLKINLRQSRYEENIKFFESLTAESFNKDPDILRYAARSYDKNKQHDKALTIYKEIPEAMNNPTALTGMALALKRKGKFSKAISYMKKALNMAYNERDAISLSMMYLNHGQHEIALDLLKTIKGQDKDLALLKTATIYEAQGKSEETIFSLLQITNIAENEKASLLLDRHYMKLGQYELAHNILINFKYYSRSKNIILAIAQNYHEQKQYQSIINLFEQNYSDSIIRDNNDILIAYIKAFAGLKDNNRVLDLISYVSEDTRDRLFSLAQFATVKEDYYLSKIDDGQKDLTINQAIDNDDQKKRKRNEQDSSQPRKAKKISNESLYPAISSVTQERLVWNNNRLTIAKPSQHFSYNKHADLMQAQNDYFLSYYNYLYFVELIQLIKTNEDYSTFHEKLSLFLRKSYTYKMLAPLAVPFNLYTQSAPPVDTYVEELLLEQIIIKYSNENIFDAYKQSIAQSTYPFEQQAYYTDCHFNDRHLAKDHFNDFSDYILLLKIYNELKSGGLGNLKIYLNHFNINKAYYFHKEEGFPFNPYSQIYFEANTFIPFTLLDLAQKFGTSKSIELIRSKVDVNNPFDTLITNQSKNSNTAKSARISFDLSSFDKDFKENYTYLKQCNLNRKDSFDNFKGFAEYIQWVNAINALKIGDKKRFLVAAKNLNVSTKHELFIISCIPYNSYAKEHPFQDQRKKISLAQIAEVYQHSDFIETLRIQQRKESEEQLNKDTTKRGNTSRFTYFQTAPDPSKEQHEVNNNNRQIGSIL